MSGHRREAALGKTRREEVERQAEAELRLKKQEIQLQSTKDQLELDVVVEEIRQKLTKANIEEAEYLEDASEISEFPRSRSKLAMAVQENQTEEDRTRSWVNTHFPAQEIFEPRCRFKVSTWELPPSSCNFQVLNRLSAGI